MITLVELKVSLLLCFQMATKTIAMIVVLVAVIQLIKKSIDDPVFFNQMIDYFVASIKPL